jgi:ADP-L-glycero-D-manno-heptose 6-epimerase
MIVITGAAGFIGSAWLSEVNSHYPGLPVVIVDKFNIRNKRKNYQGKNWLSMVDREAFFGFFGENHQKIRFVFHLGARTDTTESDVALLNRLNLDYSKKMWIHCTQYEVPLIYASSAATYGDGSSGYSDDHELIPDLHPLNAYGASKNDFDKWVLQQEITPPFWAGLKFFNVYGPNEYHKGRMASVIFHAFNQIRIEKKMRLFRSHHPDFRDGQQLRDFIYVRDVLKAIRFLYETNDSVQSGIYNVGTGKARSFEDLTLGVFRSLGLKPNIEYIDMPEDIRHNYQYYTRAEMNKLKTQGFDPDLFSLEAGVEEYVKRFLFEKSYL